MANEVKIQVSLTGAQAAAQQIAGLKSALESGSAPGAGSSSASGTIEKIAESADKAGKSVHAAAEEIKIGFGSSAAGIESASNATRNMAAGLSGAGGLIDKITAKLKESTVASGAFWGSLTGNAMGRVVEFGIQKLIKGFKQLNAEWDRADREKKNYAYIESSAYDDQYRREVRDRQQKALVSSLNEESPEELIARQWNESGHKLINSTGNISEFRAAVEREKLRRQQEAERASVADDLSSRTAKAFVESRASGDTAEYDRLRGLQRRFESGELSREYSASSPKAALEMAEAETAAAKAKTDEDKKALDLYKERVRHEEEALAAAAALGDKAGMAEAQAEKWARTSGMAEKLGGGDVDKGLGIFSSLYSKAAAAADKRRQEDSQYTTAPAMEFGSAKAAQAIAQIMAGATNPQVDEIRNTNDILRRMLDLMGAGQNLTGAIPVFGG
jgi:hypothetical protein